MRRGGGGENLEIATGPREVCVLEGLGNHELDTHELPEKLCLEMV